MNKTLFLSSVWLAFSVLASAQTSEDSSRSKSVRGRKAWFLTVAIPKEVDNPVEVLLGDKTQEVTLSLRSMSDAVKIPADGIVRMVKSIPDPTDAEKTIYKDLAVAQIPESMKEAMIICVPRGGKDSGPIYKTKVFDLKDFRGGDSLFLNLSPENLGVSLGEKKVHLPPGDFGVIDLDDLPKSTKMPIGYHIQDKETKKWSVFSASYCDGEAFSSRNLHFQLGF